MIFVWTIYIQFWIWKNISEFFYVFIFRSNIIVHTILICAQQVRQELMHVVNVKNKNIPYSVVLLIPVRQWASIILE